jgi:hypothetical protein
VIEILRDHKKLVDTRKNRSGADPFVIALAKVEGCNVITGEKPTNRLERPHIPDVCRETLNWYDPRSPHTKVYDQHILLEMVNSTVEDVRELTNNNLGPVFTRAQYSFLDDS